MLKSKIKFLISLCFVICVFTVLTVSVSAVTPIRLHFPDGNGGWEVVEKDFSFEGAGATNYWSLETNEVVYDNNKTGDLEILTVPYGWHFTHCTLDTDVLKGPSDAGQVQPASYFSLPRYQEVNIWETNDIIYFDYDAPPDPALKETTIIYPDSSGIMQSAVIKGLDTETFTIYNNRVEDSHGNVLVSFGFPCDSYTEESLTVYESQYVPLGSLPAEFTFGIPVISAYKYGIDLQPPVIREIDAEHYLWDNVHPSAKYRAYFVGRNGNRFSVDLGSSLSLSPYDFVPEPDVLYDFYIKAFVKIDRITYESDMSNDFAYMGKLPFINDFHVVDGEKLLKFNVSSMTSEKYPVKVQVLVNSVPADFNGSVGDNTFDVAFYSGLNSFKIKVTNKFGSVVSEAIDFNSAFADDTYGCFYVAGKTFDGIIDAFKSVKFFGISLWMMLCTMLVINFIIPIIWIIVAPHSGTFMLGGNKSKRNNDYDNKGGGKHD